MAPGRCRGFIPLRNHGNCRDCAGFFARLSGARCRIDAVVEVEARVVWKIPPAMCLGAIAVRTSTHKSAHPSRDHRNGARRKGMPSSEANNAIVANMGCGIESFAGDWRAIELPKMAQDAGSQRKPMKRGFIRPNVARGRSARGSAPIRAVGPRPDAFPGVPAKGGGRECFRRAQAVPTPGPAPPGSCGLA